MSQTEKQNKKNWAELDQDVLSIILHKVGAINLLEHAQFVCKPWRKASFNPCIWKVTDFTTSRWDCMVEIDLEKMTREAVDRSKGQMEELWIEYFGSDDLLRYIADRSSALKRLHLISAYDISNKGLIDLVKRQPQLEELNITFGAYSDAIFKEVGKACPNLRCFRYNKTGSRYDRFEHDQEAYDIADNMPELCVLQLVGNTLTNKGLVQILDKCKHLESLDIRCCFCVDVNDEIRAKAKELKEFRLPLDSTEDYGFVAEIEYDMNHSDDEDDGDCYYYPSGCSDVDYEDEMMYYDDYSLYDGSYLTYEAIMGELRNL